MAYNEELAARIEQILDAVGAPDLVSKKMFGGVGYMVQGNMACGIHREFLIVRGGADRHDELLSMPWATEFNITGKTMRGWVMVEEAGCEDDDDLTNWVRTGLDFAMSLPPK